LTLAHSIYILVQGNDENLTGTIAILINFFNSDFYFSDLSSDEIKSSSVSVVKQVLSKKINEANYTV
jgi:hypothetical protein